MDCARIAIVDDHPLLREGLSQAIAREADLVVVAQGESAADALAIARDLQPNLMLLDLNMPGDPLRTIAAIARVSPHTCVAILTASDDEDELLMALRQGVRGYILKGVTGRELVAIARRLLAGGSYVPPILAAGALRSLTAPRSLPPVRSELDTLTERERQILGLVAEGLSNREIGGHLHLTEKTVKYYMTAIMEKLHVRSRVEAALVAAREARRHPGVSSAG